MSHLKPAAHQNKSSSSPLSRLVQKLRRTSPEPPIPIFAPAKPDVPSDIPCAPPRELAPVSALSSARVVEEQEAPPPVAQAVVHLALLEVFWRYKQRFLDPSAEVKTFFGSALGWPEDEAWEQQDAQVVWEVVVEIAVGRFEAWWKIVGREVEKLKWEDRPGNDGPGNWTPDDGIIRNVTELPLEMLPPLDVLMVWHSFMLNPRSYWDDCFALGVPSMLSVAFPWVAVHSAIDLDTLEYSLSSSASQFFTVSTSQQPDLLTELQATSYSGPRIPRFEIPCPSCQHEHTVAISLDGWLNPDLALDCGCGFKIDHAALAADRLRQDIHQLVSGGPCIRGTFSHPLEQGKTINAILKQHYGSTSPTLSSHPTIASLLAPLPNPGQTIPFYLPQTSPQCSSSISLSAAVLRQGSYVDKMHHYLWLRSPSLPGTLLRASTKYVRFFFLFKEHPGETMVPTIDVDLFWHSHQLSPALYERFCFQTTSRYIDHNDKISTNVLDIAFEATCEHYWNGYQEDYGGCFCWACEVERDDDAKLEGKNWWQKRGEKRRVWERRVKVYFWREVEKQRLVGGTAGAFPGFAGLQSVLKMGPKQRRK